MPWKRKRYERGGLPHYYNTHRVCNLGVLTPMEKHVCLRRQKNRPAVKLLAGKILYFFIVRLTGC